MKIILVLFKPEKKAVESVQDLKTSSSVIGPCQTKDRKDDPGEFYEPFKRRSRVVHCLDQMGKRRKILTTTKFLIPCKVVNLDVTSLL